MGHALGWPAEGARIAAPPGDRFPELDGNSAAIRRLKAEMWRVARDPFVTALVLGESGTGKERVARAIHRASPRAAGPFVVVDCAALSATLAEDELFGHLRGAFTGAIDDRAGPFERAHGGTLLLDEVGELTPELQMKLLRALQARTVQRLGGRHETPFDVRVIASTNVDLAHATARGRFREDLYYRLWVYELRVPPLRARGFEDIAALAAAVLARLSERRGRLPPRLDPPVLDRLTRCEWPGNVRQLENTLERMLVACGGERCLTVEHLPDRFGDPAGPIRSRDGLPPPADVRAALDRSGGRVGRAAADLGVSRHQLYRLRRRTRADEARGGT